MWLKGEFRSHFDVNVTCALNLATQEMFSLAPVASGNLVKKLSRKRRKAIHEDALLLDTKWLRDDFLVTFRYTGQL